MYKRRFIYNAKKLFKGDRIGLNNNDDYVAIPDRHFNTSTAVMVNYAGDQREIFELDVVKKKVFNDKFRPGETYTLYYFLWENLEEGE